MARIKILFIHHGTGLGGAPLSLLYLIQGLNKELYDPVVLFLHDSEVIKLYHNHGITTYGPVNLMDFSHTKIYWFRWYHPHRVLRCLIDTIKTILMQAPHYFSLIKPDIIHLNTSSLISWGIVGYIKKIPVVWHIRESLAEGYLGLRKRLVTAIIKQCASIIIPICKTDGIPWRNSAKMHVIYNAVNPQLFDVSKTIPRTTNNPTILFLGGVAEQKGTLFLLEVFASLRTQLPSVHLILAGYSASRTHTLWIKKLFGRYAYEDKVQALIAKNKEAITLTGPTNKIPSLLANCDVLVFPASVDHFARPVIEAGFMRKTSIASQFPQLEELIVNNKTGLLIPYGDHIAWVNALQKVLSDNTLNTNLAENAYTYCTEHFSLASQVAAIQNLYATLQR